MKTLKRLAAAALCALLIISSDGHSARAEGKFTDVPENEWYAGAVYELVERGVINGTSATKFSPKKELTRGAFVTMLAKTELSAEELAAYDYEGSFKDVSTAHWANKYINWASENGIVNGYKNGTFKPDTPVTRQDMAVMIVKYANVSGRRLTASNPASDFTDSESIADYAKSSVSLCQQAGIISGYRNGSFSPRGNATRAEAAKLYAGLLDTAVRGNYKIYLKRINGAPVKAVEFDSKTLKADLALARDMVDGAESAESIVSRTGAYIAVNAAFFDMNTYLPMGTLIKEGRVLTIMDKYAPAKSALTLDGNGKWAVQNFTTVYTVTLENEDGEDDVFNQVGFNTWPNGKTDGTRILFTRDWGQKLNFPTDYAIVLDADGTVKNIYTGAENVDIPENGYVLAQRAKREYESPLYDNVKVGGVLKIERNYEGAENQDIVLSIGAGPCFVKDSKPYGDISAYRAEGFTEAKIISNSSLRICLGLKPDGKMVILRTVATPAKTAEIMISMGCTDVINFDGGGSAAIYVNGCWIAGPPGRRLNTMLCFK